MAKLRTPKKWSSAVRVISFAAAGICLLCAPLSSSRSRDSKSESADPKSQGASWSPNLVDEPIARDPIWVYNDWSAYDELSDNIPLTEALAMRELNEVARLQRAGVHFDYYMMDAFWFAKDSGYRTFRTPNWPDGPDAWIAACKKNRLLPGLWFSTNTLVKIDADPRWRDSLNKNGGSMSLYEGGFLPDFMKVLQFWYDRGIRMFEFDFADFSAATPAAEKAQTPEEIKRRNVAALREALMKFRATNPDIALIAFNGFGGNVESTAGPFPFHDPVDLEWLSVFDSLYTGDPRPGDVPEMNFWRSMDIYSDHMVRRYEQSFMPLERLDSTSFMVGNTGTIYYRKTNAWKGMFLLMVARGGWVNTIHGNMEFLDDEKARWMAKVQKIYELFKVVGRTKTFGGIPGDSEPYGFGSLDREGSIYTIVNPAQNVAEVGLPLLSQAQGELGGGRVIFRDAGFVPVLQRNKVKLGPGQLVAVGFGRYAAQDFDLGVQEDVRIPRSIVPLSALFVARGINGIEAILTTPAKGDLRIIFQQRGTDGSIMRSWPGGPPNGMTVGKVLKISAYQGGKAVGVEIDYDRVIWSGLSWGAGEIKQGDFVPGQLITIRCASAEKSPVILQGKVYAVQY